MKIIRQTFVMQITKMLGRVKSIRKDDCASYDASLIPGHFYKGIYYENLQTAIHRQANRQKKEV